MVSSSWYAGWHADNFTLQNVSWDKYTHLIYSFAATTPLVSNITLNGSDADLLPQFVSMAKQNNVSAMVSVGGWAGSQYFSTNVASEENRTAFVKTITNFVQTYELDGIDFDWEYPGNQGIGCNVVSANDTNNFLSFLQALRADPVGSNLTLTASAPLKPYEGITNGSAFADVFDWINVMAYDVWGSWSPSVGPNAPLNDTCALLADQQGSAVSAVAAWTEAGVPAHQIALGVASYGRSFLVESALAYLEDNTVLAAFPLFNSTPLGDAWDNATNTDVCGNISGPSGVFDFWGMIDEGFLFANGTPAAAIDYRYDECSQTPYVYNKSTGVMISYDNAESFIAKGSYIANNNLRGFAMWEAGGDYDDILLDAIRQGAGFEDDC